MSLHNYHYANVEEEFEIISSIYHDNLTINMEEEDFESIVLQYFKEYPLDGILGVISFVLNPLEESNKTNRAPCPNIEYTTTNVDNGYIYLYLLVPKEYPKLCCQCHVHVPKKSCYKSENLKHLQSYATSIEKENDISLLLTLFESHTIDMLIMQTDYISLNHEGIKSDSSSKEVNNDGNHTEQPSSTTVSFSNTNAVVEPARVTDFSLQNLNSLSDSIVELSLKNVSKPQPFHVCKNKESCTISVDKLKDEMDRNFVLGQCLVHNCDHCSGTIYGKFGSCQLPKVYYFKQYVINIKSLALLKVYSINHLNNYMSNVIDDVRNLDKHDYHSILNIHYSSKVFFDEKIYLTYIYDANLLSFHTMSSLFTSLSSPFGVTEIIIHKYAISMLKALDYLHRNNICYGKLEPCNILVSNDGELLLFDVFSFVQLTHVEYHLTKNYCPNTMKCRHFSAFHNRLYPISPQSDVYAYGLILLSLYKGLIVNESPAVVPHLLPNVIQLFIKKCFKASDDHPLPTSDLLSDYYIMHFEPMPNIWAGHNPTILSSHTSYNVDLPWLINQKQDMEAAMSCFGQIVDDLNVTCGTSRVEIEFQSFTSIGSGGFGSVISARKKLDSCVYAIKRIKLPRKNPKKLHAILKEVQIISKLNHENIVRYYNSWIGPDTKKPIFPQIEGDLDELGNEIDSESTTSVSSDNFSESNKNSSTEAGITTKDKLLQSNSSYKADKDYSTEDNENSDYFQDTFNNSVEFNSINCSSDDDDNDTTIEFYDYSNYVDQNSSSDSIVFRCSSGDLEYYDKAIMKIKADTHDAEINSITRGRTFSAPPDETNVSKGSSMSSKKFGSQDEVKSLSERLPPSENLNRPRKHFYFYIQMEYCEKKTLYEVIENEEIYSNNDRIMKLFRGILEGIAYVHDKGLIHRDLKPGNIFISTGDNPKIGDFGLAKLKSSLKGPARQNSIEAVHFNSKIAMNNLNTTETQPASAVAIDNSTVSNLALDSKSNSANIFDSMNSLSSYDDSYESCVGTFIYNAPELSNSGNCVEDRKETKITSKSDVYSLGIVFYEMLHPPFATKFERIINISALRNDDKFVSSYTIEKTHLHLLNMMLKKDPEQRASARDLLEHNLVPTNMDDCKFVHAINQVLNDKASNRFRTLFSLLFNKRRQLLMQPNTHNSTSIINYPCHDFAFLGAKSIAWKCLNRLLNDFTEHIGAISPYLPDVLSDSLVYYQFLFELPSESNDFLTMSKSGDLISLTSSFTKRLGYYLANMEFSKIPAGTFSLMAGIANFPNLVSKLVMHNNGPVNEQKCIQKSEYCISQLVYNDATSITNGIVQVVLYMIKFLRVIIQKVNKYSARFQTLSDKNKKIRFMSFSPSSKLTVVLNHFAIVGHFLVNNGVPISVHGELAHILEMAKKDERRSQLVFDFIRHKRLDSACSAKVYRFLNFRGTIEKFKRLLNDDSSYTEHINQLQFICDQLESSKSDIGVEIAVDLLSGLSLNAGYISFNVEIQRTNSKAGNKPTEVIIFGGLSPVFLHKHISYPLNLSNLSPFVGVNPEVLGFSNTTSQDDNIVVYSCIPLEPIIMLCLFLHREESCIIEDSCASRRLVILAFVSDSCSDLTYEHKLYADNLLQEVIQSSDLYVHTISNYISHETISTLKSYYSYLNLKAFVLFDVHTKEFKILFYECNRKVHEQKFSCSSEVVEYLKSRIGSGSGNTSVCSGLICSGSSRKEENNPVEHYKNITVASTDVCTPSHSIKKTTSDIEFVCTLPERTSNSLRRKYESKALIVVKPYLSWINSDCKIIVFLTLLADEEFSFMVGKVSTSNFSRNINFKKEIEKVTSIQFPSSSRARLGSIYDAICETHDKANQQKSGKPHIFILYSGLLDKAKLLL